MLETSSSPVASTGGGVEQQWQHVVDQPHDHLFFAFSSSSACEPGKPKAPRIHQTSKKDAAPNKEVFCVEEFLANARERAVRRSLSRPSAEESLPSCSHHQQIVCIKQQLSYLLRSTQALIAVNSEIWARCQEHSSLQIVKGVLPFSCVSVPQVKTTVDPTRKTTTFRIQTNVISKDFGALPAVPQELSELLAVPYLAAPQEQEQDDNTGGDGTSTRTCSTGGGSFLPDYFTYLDKATLLRDEALLLFLLKLKDHLESVHVFLGSIEAWLMEAQCQENFLQETFFDGMSQQDHHAGDKNNYEEVQRDVDDEEMPTTNSRLVVPATGGRPLVVPCGANGGDQRCCTFPHPESSICLRCQKTHKAHHRGLSRHGTITHLCDYYARNVGSFLKTIDDYEVIRIVHPHDHPDDHCLPCHTSSSTANDSAQYIIPAAAAAAAAKYDESSVLVMETKTKNGSNDSSNRFGERQSSEAMMSFDEASATSGSSNITDDDNDDDQIVDYQQQQE